MGVNRGWKARRHKLRAYNRDVKAIERDHNRRVRNARAELKKVEKTHRGRVSSLEKQLQRARTPDKLDGVWSTKGWARLLEDRVETSKGTIPLSTSVIADISTSGNLAIGGRSTLTRMGTGAVIAGPLGFMVGMAAKKDRKVDTRELYLIVQDNDGGIVVPCSPDQDEKVRQFALNLMAAARRAPQAAQARRRLVQEAERALNVARSDTGNVESARETVESVETERLALPQPPSQRPGPRPLQGPRSNPGRTSPSTREVVPPASLAGTARHERITLSPPRTAGPLSPRASPPTVPSCLRRRLGRRPRPRLPQSPNSRPSMGSIFSATCLRRTGSSRSTVESWVRLRASTWGVTARSPIGSAVKIGVAALPQVPCKSSCSWRQPVRFTLALRATTPRRFVC